MNELWTYTVNGAHEAMSAVEPPDDAYDEGSLTRWHSRDEIAMLKQQRDALLAALKDYANRENWGYYDPSGCPKGYGSYTDACFIGPEVAEAAIDAALESTHD